MDYTAHMTARAEHEQRVRSAPRVSDYGDHLAARNRKTTRFPVQLMFRLLISILHVGAK
jgi:hypothetical protein